ncbi:helix-turn-helix domain-containing protein [Chitinophaga flava]|uniref:HTH cro/C1-type domain-containing protein n=1 Tax=Chitinophaga flava TaxID=2259036 RepID=A0A365XSH2_9BACT|nr:helix-turn-helix transcriptional regulator [Chitinophaga flava]RBL88545.1 hypothetical protein DF182_18370 [Chitinophaga flava]
MTDGQRILYIRKLIKKSQQDFALMLGISQAALSDIENEKNGISYPVFKRLVEEVGIHPYWFMWEQDPIFRDNSFHDKYKISYKDASPTASVSASATSKKATGKKSGVQPEVTMEDILKELTMLRGEVSKIKQEGKKSR